MGSSPLLSSFDKDGFVVVPSLISHSKIKTLRQACDDITQFARTGFWPYIRTLPKEFPPWPSTPGEDGIWGVQHLLHPALPHRDEFAQMYFDNGVLCVVRELLGNEELIMELFNLLVGVNMDFELRWHRDDIPTTATADEELVQLGKPKSHVQYNIALYDDESLIVIPGSHMRARTETERDADPFEDVLPEMHIVRLKPGDAVFYNNNILHRGVYKIDKKRATMHGSVGCIGIDGGKGRARNVLQHGLLSWIENCDFRNLEEHKTAEEMKERILKIGRETNHVGFAHEE